MNIIQKPSQNFENRYGFSPDIIVNHITAGTKVSSALNWFANPAAQASSHFIVDVDGTIYQCVPIDKAAWGNGTSVKAGDNRYYGLSTIEAVKSRRTNANFYTVSIEHVNVGGGALTALQLAATIELHKYIISEVKRIYDVTIPIDRNHIVGHYQINPVTKPNCPGACFPFDKILAGLTAKPVATCDTTKDIELAHDGGSYQFKITSATAPKVNLGGSGVAIILPRYVDGNDHYYYIVGIGKVGEAVGLYVNDIKQFVAKIK